LREIRSEIGISAPTKSVWKILTDFNRWKDWNPIVNDASGIAALGSELSVTMRGKEGKQGPKFSPIVMDFEAQKSFRWRGKMMFEFLFTNDKILELEETSSGTRLVHKERFS